MSKKETGHGSSALYILIAVFIFGPLIEGGTTHLPVLVIKQATVLAGLTALFIAYRDGRIRVALTGLEAPLMAFAAAAAYSVYIAPNRYMALVWAQLFFFYAVFLYLSTWSLLRPGGRRLAAYSVLVAGAVQAAVVVYGRMEGLPRAKGTFFNPNMMAGYVVPCAAMGLAMLLAVRNRSGNGFKRAALAVYLLTCLYVILLSGSRGGVLSLAAATSVVLWFRFRFRAVAVAGLLAALVVVVPNPVKDRIFSSDPVAYSRKDIWLSAVERLRDHPGGLGLGNFKYYSDRYNFRVDEEVQKYGRRARTAHNEYLHFASEMGVPGIIALVLLMAWYARVMALAERSSRGSPDEYFVKGAVGGSAGILAHSLVDSNLHEPGTVLMLLLLTAVAVSARMEKGGPVYESDVAGRGRLFAAAAVLLTLASAWSAAEYAAYYYKDKSVEQSKAGDLAGALDSSYKAMRLEPLNPDYVSNAAATNFKMFTVGRESSRLEESLDLLSRAGELNPLDVKYPSLDAYVRTEAARLMPGSDERREMLGKALGSATRAVELSPRDVQARYRRASLLLQNNMPEEAEEELNTLAVLEPNFFKGRLLLAIIYDRTGRAELSKAEARSIIEDYRRLPEKDLVGLVKEFVSFDMDTAKKLAGNG